MSTINLFHLQASWQATRILLVLIKTQFYSTLVVFVACRDCFGDENRNGSFDYYYSSRHHPHFDYHYINNNRDWYGWYVSNVPMKSQVVFGKGF